MKKIFFVILSLGLLGVLKESTTQAYCSSCTYSYSAPVSYTYSSPAYTYLSSCPTTYYYGGCCRGSLHWGGYWY